MERNSQKRIVNIIMAGVVLLILALSVVWFLHSFQLEEKEIRGQVSKEAKRNPFLAAELFLRKAGVNVESVSGRTRLHELPPTEDTLFVNNFGPNLSSERYQSLLDWIKAGGHLVTTAHKAWDEKKGKSGDQLLDDLGIHLVDYYYDSEDDNEPSGDEDDSEMDTYSFIDTNFVEVPFESGETVKVNFDPYYALIDSREIATARVAGEYGIHLVQVPLGEGIVTIMSDNQFLTNPDNSDFFDDDSKPAYFSTSIAVGDHAYYLWLLLEDNTKVWLLYSLQTSGLWVLLWQKAQLVCISVLALLVIWLWWQRNRFGPYRANINPARRNYIEHIQMAGNYLWRQDKGQQLFTTNRDQFLHWLSLKHPQLSSLSETEQCQKIADLCNLPSNTIHQTLFGHWKTEREFIQLTSILQTMRKKL